MGFFDRLSDLVEDMRTLGKETRQEFCELTESTYATFNDDYKTSYDRRSEASSIISREKQRLQNECNELNRQIEEFNARANSLNSRAQQILQNHSLFASSIRFKADITLQPASYSDIYPNDEYLDNPDIVSTLIRSAHADEYLANAENYSSLCAEKRSEISRSIKSLFRISLI